eukprot:1887142-Pyramimonas_sp.AAC.1
MTQARGDSVRGRRLSAHNSMPGDTSAVVTYPPRRTRGDSVRGRRPSAHNSMPGGVGVAGLQGGRESPRSLVKQSFKQG